MMHFDTLKHLNDDTNFLNDSEQPVSPLVVIDNDQASIQQSLSPVAPEDTKMAEAVSDRADSCQNKIKGEVQQDYSKERLHQQD